MKRLNKFYSILFLIPLLIASCIKNPDGPPIIAPVYDGPEPNFTIAQLKALGADLQSGQTRLIEVEYIIKAYVIGNDETGNIFKQLYVRDNTGAINIGVDQNSMYTTYRIGQELNINMHNLYLVNYGGELQIGYVNTTANRIPWDIFRAKDGANGFPDRKNAEPVVKRLSELDPVRDVNTLVRFNDVYFPLGGRVPFVTEGDDFGNITLQDGPGNTITVRTSKFALFAQATLPSGGGNVVGLLGRFNGSWQLIIRSTADLIQFGGPIPPKPGEEGVVFNETFGIVDPPTTPRPTLETYEGFDETSVTWSGTGDIRKTNTFNNHVWLKAGAGNIKIEGINTAGQSGLSLSYDITANIYNDGDQANVNILKVYCDGNELTVPNFVLDKPGGYGTKFYNAVISGLPANFTSVEFRTDASNTLGLRVDNIKIYKDDSIVLP